MITGQRPAKMPKPTNAYFDNITSCRPVFYLWTWTKDDGHDMISIKYSPNAGMFSETTAGFAVHAVGTRCTITADWPKTFYDVDRVRKYYSPEELADKDTQRMLIAEEDTLRQLMAHTGGSPRTTLVIPLPFPVIETRDPPTNYVSILECGTRTITIQLASAALPKFVAKKRVIQVTTFAE